MSSPTLTIFTAPKPFKDPHISIIQYNAIKSWKELGSDVDIILIGDEYGVQDVAKEMDVHFSGSVKRNEKGTPLISSIFNLGRGLNQSPLLAYINADILIFSDFLETAITVSKNVKRFLLVGQRWDLNIEHRIDFSNGWAELIKTKSKTSGKLHSRAGSDYFIYPRDCFKSVPDFAVGRAGWDNWMFYEARKNNWACIDATKSIQIIHQNHDYSHLPDGQPHYRLPETNINVRLAGGKRTIFTLMDVNFMVENSRIQKIPLNWEKFWREVEIFPLITLKSKWLANLFFAILHPQKAITEVRTWYSSKKRKDRKNYA